MLWLLSGAKKNVIGGFMAETVNIGEIANTLSRDIFKHFLWKTHPKWDDNFKCNNPEHKSDGGTPKLTHPGDVVFFYEDPYLGKRIYLHTDLKSYSNSSISTPKVRDALRSLCMTVDCATASSDWRVKYSVDESERFEVRGMLFVHNHDNQYKKSFNDALARIDLSALPLPPQSIVHFLGPLDIQRLYNIANDLIRLKGEGELPQEYTFFYPDLVISRRQWDVWNQAATVESLAGPYLIIKHTGSESFEAGYVIYYNSPCESVEEFEYFLDSLSRYQMLESKAKIRIRVTADILPEDLKSLFHSAKNRYSKAWGFDPTRAAILDRIHIDPLTAVTSTYTPGNMGWRE